ncbi:hypothetical protein [Actinokineospora diospyrosa]|uniref:Elongation factor Tu-like protein n=1 Tax=Actinokineospora diospyrosa TaxID=103728 RepID=A0ABT1IKT4_9PSEU|nr:hypothetical protein [Actinokineospora diospyrosa]MCP2273264.1 hypothetical protein [Actinokineospora diospyrosa]
MEKIENPVAEAEVRWRSAAEGGRRSGNPTAPVYMATAGFVTDEDSEVDHGRVLSVLLQKTGELDEQRWTYLVGFLVPELALPHLRSGGVLQVLEGPRIVGTARITAVLGEPSGE